ncbi:MAG: histidine triad nucleotide-binding protein [Candidatus Saganbacteria bacterium]|nr:histidine triad nucleotide-binding protein [Candidatus Saganbacteria bacterium]
MTECVFCKIAGGKIKSDIIYQDDDVVAFNDMDPQAPVHILLVPKEHIERIEKVKDHSVVQKIFKAANKIVREKGLEKDGFRIVVNSGRHGGQAVFHLHFHLLGGRQMTWPPG